MTKMTFFMLVVNLFFMPLTYAGSAQSRDSQLPVEQVEVFAKQVEQYAAEQGARAFIIARVGRPESELPDGIKFTHTAIALYSEISLSSGEKVKGYAVHNLYQKAGQRDKSELVVDYPVDFFWGVSSLKAGIIIPTVDVQQRIIEVIASGKDKKIHNVNYSVIANPFNNEFQNCTEHTLNIINAGIYQTTDIAVLKSNAKQHFQSQRVKISPLKLMLGNLFVDDVSTKDHRGKVSTATFTTISQYLQKNDLLEKSVVITGSGDVITL
tara:strand:- start:5530 stop:6330 length:801 start_codon:yes stop_codon:yes gene_type:complete